MNLWTSTTLALVAGLALAGPAQAQNQSMTQKKVGPFAIDYVIEKGKFDRCAATLHGELGMLRIAYTKDLKYSISIPGSTPPESKMYFQFGGKTFETKAYTDPKRIRAWGEASIPAIEALMNTKGSIGIDYGEGQLRWNIGKIKMEDVMVALEECTQRAVGAYR